VYAWKRTQHVVLPEDLHANMKITADKPNGSFFAVVAERVEAQLRQESSLYSRLCRRRAHSQASLHQHVDFLTHNRLRIFSI
jgi:hypothetical protein